MCKFCEDHDDIFESPLLYHVINLGFGGDVHTWVYLDAVNMQLSLHLLNDSSGRTLEFNRGCNFCPICGKEFLK